jgi:KTSC domain
MISRPSIARDPANAIWTATRASAAQVRSTRVRRELITFTIMRRVWIVMLMLTAVGAIRCADPPEARDSEQVICHIPRQRVDSSAIAKVGYSKRRHVLEIEFVNGAIYRYLDVPSSVYRDLISAESKARFYDFNIKGKYRSARVQLRIKDKSAN